MKNNNKLILTEIPPYVSLFKLNSGMSYEEIEFSSNNSLSSDDVFTVEIQDDKVTDGMLNKLIELFRVMPVLLSGDTDVLDFSGISAENVITGLNYFRDTVK